MSTTFTYTENGTTYHQGAELPDLPVAWLKEDGTLYADFASGWTFSVSVMRKGSTAPAFIKTTGITASATSPNITVAWSTTGELNSLTPGVYTVQITATRTSDGKERIMELTILVRSAAGFVPVGGGAILYATDVDLDAEIAARIAADAAHAATPHGGEASHPDLAAHDLLGLATDTDLTTEINRATVAEASLIPLTQKGAANGVATLGADSKIPSAQIPALAIGEVSTVASQAAMLALTAQRGDIAVRTDLDPDGVFILTTDDPTVLANWVQITAPGAVVSVNGQSGAVVLPSDGAAGTASLRTLGTGATQAAAGNDARLSDQRVPTDGSVTTTKVGDGQVTAAKVAGDVATQAELDALAATELAPFSRAGALTVVAGKGRFRLPYAATILGVSAAIDTAPTGAALLLDVNKNGTTIFTTQANRPTIAAGANATAAEVTNMNVTALAAGDYLTVDVDQIGSTVAGSDLTVLVRYRPV